MGTFVYGYRNDTGELQVWVQETKECPVVVDIMGIVLGVIGAIVAIGLALILMWKVFTTIHDRREFARFEKERIWLNGIRARTPSTNKQLPPSKIPHMRENEPTPE